MFRKNVLFSLLVVLAFLLGGCAKKSENSGQPSFDELKNRAIAAMEHKKNEVAILQFEQMLMLYPENQDVFEFKLMLADLYLKTGRLDMAYKLYRNYSKMYPSDIKAEYANYKSILSKFYQTLKVSKDCDDTDAHKTVKRCKNYLGNPVFAQFRDDVRDVQYTCERRLIDKEVYVFNTYVRRGQLQSAKNRIDYLRTTFLPNHPKLAAQLLFMESKVAKRQKDDSLLREKIETLITDYPDSQYTRMAQGLLSSKQRKFDFV